MIPSHLNHLRTWRGLPVPYINIWSDEADEHAIIHGPDATVGMDAWFATGEQGVGTPDFTRQCPQRQRLVARYGLCQVCLRELPKKRRNLIVLGDKTRSFGGRTRLLVSEPFVCNRCVEYVLRVCPGVRKARPMVLDLKSWNLSIETQWHDDYGRDVVAAMWINIEPVAVVNL